MTRQNRVRLDLHVSDVVKAKLEALARSEGATLSDIVRRALAVYEVIVAHTREGATIQIKKGNTVKELVL